MYLLLCVRKKLKQNDLTYFVDEPKFIQSKSYDSVGISLGKEHSVVDILMKLIQFKTVALKEDEIDSAPRDWLEDYERFPFWLKDFLESYGINVEIIKKGRVNNVVAKIKFSNDKKTFAFNGHWDVVPPGDGWTITEPFKPKIHNGRIYGRGACDMKGGLAAMLKTIIDFSTKREGDLNGTLYLLAVGDEEVGGFNGTGYVLEQLVSKGIKFDYAIVGEPTSLNIRIGRRGIIRIKLKVKGSQCHSARADECENVIFNLCKIVQKIESIKIDEESDPAFPPTSINPTMISSGVAPNIIPGDGEILIDVRNTPYVSLEDIMSALEGKLVDLKEKYNIEKVEVLAKPFKTSADSKLVRTLVEVIMNVTGRKPRMNAYGGSSDAKFFADRGIQVAEVGVDDKTLHHADEWASIDTLVKLVDVYKETVKKLLS